MQTLPSPDRPTGLFHWHGSTRPSWRKTHVHMRCAIEGEIITTELKTDLSLADARRIAKGLSMVPSETIAAEIAGRRLLRRAARLFWTDPFLAGLRPERAASSHEALARVSHVDERLRNVEPIALPPHLPRIPYLDVRSQAALVEADGPLDGLDTRRHLWRADVREYREPRRILDLRADTAEHANLMARAIAGAELQHLVAFLVLRDPEPQRLGWADALLGYVRALSPRSRTQAVAALAGVE